MLDAQVDPVKHIAVLVLTEDHILELNVPYFPDLSFPLIDDFSFFGVDYIEYISDATHGSFYVPEKTSCIYCLEKRHQKTEHRAKHVFEFIQFINGLCEDNIIQSPLHKLEEAAHYNEHETISKAKDYGIL